MADDKPITDVDGAEGHDACDGPNRMYRRLFVYVSMLFAWATALLLSKFGSGEIAKLVADSMCTYVIVIGPSYLLGHSVDRSEILTRMGESFQRKE